VTNEPTEMELRVARCICATYRYPGFDPASDVVSESWEVFLDSARAAIRAMRSPTTEMLTCGYAAGYAADNGADEVTEVLAEIVYTAMIRAASPQEE